MRGLETRKNSTSSSISSHHVLRWKNLEIFISGAPYFHIQKIALNLDEDYRLCTKNPMRLVHCCNEQKAR